MAQDGIVNPNTLETFIYTLKDREYGLPRTADVRTPVEVELFPGLALAARTEDL